MTDPVRGPTPREAEILELLLAAHTTAQIAERLGLAQVTVRHALDRLRGYYRAPTASALVAIVLGARLRAEADRRAKVERDLAALDRRGRGSA